MVHKMLRGFGVFLVLVAGFFSVALIGPKSQGVSSDQRVLHQPEYVLSSSLPLTKSPDKVLKPDVVASPLPSLQICGDPSFHSDNQPLDPPRIVAGHIFTQFVSSAL
jgi:hypothetical protein